MKFSKTLLAAAMLASAGAANASIQTGSNTASEAYLAVYDSARGLTFNLDLGLTFGEIVNNIANPGFSKSYDLNALTASSANAQWSVFANGLDSTKTFWGVVAAGTTGRILATGPALSPAKFPTLNTAINGVTSLTNHINQVNTAAIADNAGVVDGVAQNLSAIVSDSDTANTGQFNQPNLFSTLSGTKSDAQAAIKYGETGKFYFYAGGAAPVLAAQQWKLAGNTLNFSTPAAVPLPAAVWMFGTGLLGLLGMNRRKGSAA